jgi:hypothetical protein
MAYDFNRLLRPSKRRVPEEQNLYLLALNIASVMCGFKPGCVSDSEEDLARVRYVAHELERAAGLYYKAALEEADVVLSEADHHTGLTLHLSTRWEVCGNASGGR